MAAEEAICVIPARYGSTRFPAKMLADLAGKPLLQHVWEGVRSARRVTDVLIATDDARIEQAARRFGAQVVMTSPACASGTDRVAEVARSRKDTWVINVQGDEPLMRGSMIDQLVQSLRDDSQAPAATLCTPLSDPKQIESPHVVKVVMDQSGYAIYFSRSPIPHWRDRDPKSGPTVYKHLGIYGYRRDFLLKLSSWPPTPLERSEKLEQLRVLEHGFKMKVSVTEFDSIGVDTPEDLERVAKIIRTVTLNPKQNEVKASNHL